MITNEYQLRGAFGPVLHYEQVGDDVFIIVQLAFHVALYLNPTPDYGYDERYCMCNEEVARAAIKEYARSGAVKYWQKHHNKNISVKGNYLYRSGELMIPDNAIGMVDWDVDDVRENGVKSVSSV